ncbi:MAG: hypothetical protein AABX30_02420 [Nanoarchaeota archaeon]
MAKKGGLQSLLGFVAWFTGVLVSLAVGFGMIAGTLTIPYIESVVPFAGWIVVLTTLLSLILALAHKFS